MRNPDWVRDEVILALDLYFRADRKQLPPSHPEVVALSELLRSLPFDGDEERGQNFRNPNGISMILGNFLGVDPSQLTPGLGRNNSLHQAVWDDFASHPAALRATADAIRIAAEGSDGTQRAAFALTDDEVFPEGELLTRLHLARERSRDLVERKKQDTLSVTGRLACEVCGFDFAAAYGRLGEGFAECHHLLPLATLAQQRTSRLSDLAVVCANCHRMLHKSRPLLAVAELRSLLVQRHRPSSEQVPPS